MKNNLPIAIIGAGPVGLAAAAHLTLRNLPFIIFEAGNTVAANVLDWAHVRVFSPWKYNIDKAARQLLSAIYILQALFPQYPMNGCFRVLPFQFIELNNCIDCRMPAAHYSNILVYISFLMFR